MTARNHMLINFSAGLWLNLSPAYMGILIFSSIFPDMVDYYTTTPSSWWEKHRHWSHFWAVYAAVFVILTLTPSGRIIRPYPAYFTLGCFIHILCDFLTPMGVPFLTPSRRVAIPLFKRASATETLFSLTFFIVTAFLKAPAWIHEHFGII